MSLNKFGSNSLPRKFGKGGNEPEDWTCICGHVNSGRMVKKVAKRIVCWMCGIEKEYAEKVNALEPS